MSPKKNHGFIKDIALQLVTIYADELDVDEHGYGSTTWRQKKKAKGAEAYILFTLKMPLKFAQSKILT